MNTTLNIIIKVTLVVMVGGIASCGDEKPPASQPKVVSQKIKQEQVKAEPATKTVVTNSEDNAAPKSESAEKKSIEESAAQKTAAAPLDRSAQVTSDLIKASLEMSSTYDPTGRINPFAPLFSEEPKKSTIKAKTGRKVRRKPQTPLEKVSLSQLKLTAIMRMPQGNRALVEDATGKGYVVQKGTYMGLNAGQVIKIDKDRVVIEEEIQDMVGEYIINNTELKLQKPAGDK